MKTMNTVKSVDAWPLLVVIGIGATSHHIPPLAEQFYAVGLHVEGVLLVLPITMVGDVQHTVFLHRLDDGLQVVLARRDIFQQDAVFDALAVGQGIAHTERVVEPRAKAVLADVLHIIYIVAVFATILIDDVDAEHVPDHISPVVEGALGNLHAPADVRVAEPFLVQLLEGNLLRPMDGLNHPYVFADEALSSVVVYHLFNHFSAKIWQGYAKWWQRCDYFWLYTLQNYEKSSAEQKERVLFFMPR